MAGVALVFKANSGPLVGHLARLSARQEWTKARREIGEFMLGNIQDNFDGQRLFDGTPMPQSKAAAKRGGKTLIDHHHLYDSYTFNLVRGGIEVGSDNQKYAAIHHFGGVTGRGHKTKIDARPVLGVGDKQERAIGDYLINAIQALQ